MMNSNWVITVVLLVVICFWVPIQCISEFKKIPLYFSYISSIFPKRGFSAAGLIPAIELALEMVNNRTDILANYSLQHTMILDSKCDRTAALDAFFDHFTNDDNHTYIATACCGCSVATIPVAEISHYWNVPQMSYSTALVLNDRSRLRNFFRTLSTNKNLGPGIVRIVRQFGWRKMLVVTQNEELFTGLLTVLQALFDAQNWLIDVSLIISSSVNSFPLELVFKKIEDEYYNIIFVNSYSHFAYSLFCEAFQRRMIAPRYIWMTHLWYNTEWWRYFQNENSPCSHEDMQVALNGSIGVIPDGYVLRDQTVPTFSGLTSDQFISEYTRRFLQFQINNASFTSVSLPNVGFDLVWSLALGLDIAVDRIALNNDSGCEDVPGEIVPFEDFDYSNKKMGCILRESIGSVEFEGLSGPIKFNENGSQPDNLLQVQQYQYLSNKYVERTTVAKIDISTDSINFINTFMLWEEVPYDGYPEESIDQYHIALFIIYSILIISGLIFSFACFIFNILFRNKKILRLSSPNLNYLIILGSVILYISVFTYMYMPSDVDNFTSATVICNVRIWLFSIGYTICFAVILSKTWRVYYIFNSPSPTKKVIKDWMLFVLIAAVVLGDLTILLIGTSIGASRLEANQIKSIENPTTVEEDLRVKQNYIYVCLKKGETAPIIWLSISYAYKGILQIIGIFMAFHVRKVKIKALNDSKQTAAIIYINTIILITLITAAFTLDNYHNGHAAIFGLALLIDASLFLGALFVPKMFALYHDPTEKKVFQEQSTGAVTTWQMQINDRHKHENGKDITESRCSIKRQIDAKEEKTLRV